MTIDETNLLYAKAKLRKDGVYSFHGNYWVVKDRQFVAFMDLAGVCYQRFSSFNVLIAHFESYGRRKKLREWLLSQ